MSIYVVQPGDTAYQIAKQWGISMETLIWDNQLVYPYELAIGQALFISQTSSNLKKEITVGGYAYPFISSWVLRNTLPYLTNLKIFSYGFTMSGELIPPQYKEDDPLIREAREIGVRPVITLTPFGEDGRFNNQLIHSVVNSEAYKQNLIENLLKVMMEKGYEGVDIDFEYILAEDRNFFTEFVAQVKDAMQGYGYETSVALAPKTSANQPGLLYEGKDYGALGAIADYVLLMTYEWGYTYGPPMAVAPINKVREVVEYALTEIAADKIHMGIPNYGYDWPLPYERGLTKARTINNVQAIRIAVENGAVIQFDEVSKSPFFRYKLGGVEHEVWFEDVRSLQAKFELIKEKELRGCDYWTIMEWFRANWELLMDAFVVMKK